MKIMKMLSEKVRELVKKGDEKRGSHFRQIQTNGWRLAVASTDRSLWGKREGVSEREE